MDPKESAEIIIDHVINGIEILAGTRTSIDLPAARLYTHAPMSIPVQVVSGKKSGPRLFLSAAIHGDEASANIKNVESKGPGTDLLMEIAGKKKEKKNYIPY